MRPFHEGKVEATVGFEPTHRGFAARYPTLSGVSTTLQGGSLGPPARTSLVCKLVCVCHLGAIA